MSYIMKSSPFKQGTRPNRTQKMLLITFMNVLAIDKHFPYLNTACMILYCFYGKNE